MKSILFSCLLFSLLLLSGVTHAEGNCPEGYYPIGGESGQPRPQGCAPIPGYEQQQGQQQTPQAPPPQWTSRWLAIATDSVKGTLGTAKDMPNRENAERAAIKDCQMKGGTQCKLDVSYSNGCAAMVVGDGGYNSNGAATVDAAVQLGMKVCANAGHTKCHLYYSACSLPVRIQ